MLLAAEHGGTYKVLVTLCRGRNHAKETLLDTGVLYRKETSTNARTRIC